MPEVLEHRVVLQTWIAMARTPCRSKPEELPSPLVHHDPPTVMRRGAEQQVGWVCAVGVKQTGDACGRSVTFSAARTWGLRSLAVCSMASPFEESDKGSLDMRPSEVYDAMCSHALDQTLTPHLRRSCQCCRGDLALPRARGPAPSHGRWGRSCGVVAVGVL